MKYIDLKTRFKELHLSKIGLGTGRFGTLISEKDSFEMLDQFVQAGGTVIDTARNYYEWVQNGRGMSEKNIGKWLMETGVREKVILSTKCGVRNEGKKWTYDLSYNNICIELEESKKALGTDEIDIYLLHRDEISRNVEEIVETMHRLYTENKIGVIGACNWNIKRILEANSYAKRNNLTSFKIIQTWWSLAEYTKEMWNDPTTTHMDDETYQYMRKNDILGMAYTSQVKGYFQKAINLGVDNVDSFLRQRIETPINLQKLEYIRKYCVQHEIDPTAFVLGYITSNSLNGISLISCNRMEQLKDIIENADYDLPENCINEIDNI